MGAATITPPPTPLLSLLSYPCIIMTAKGQPDVASRLFLRKLRDTLRIPVLALVDSDPYGLKILSVYMKGRSDGGGGRGRYFPQPVTLSVPRYVDNSFRYVPG